MTFKITDRDGDSVEIEESFEERHDEVMLTAKTEGESASVYLTVADLQKILDAAEEITGTVRAERMLPDFDEPRKATPSTIGTVVVNVEPDLSRVNEAIADALEGLARRVRSES